MNKCSSEYKFDRKSIEYLLNKLDLILYLCKLKDLSLEFKYGGSE